MRIINKTSFNDKSLYDLIRKSRIRHAKVSLIRFVETNEELTLSHMGELVQAVGVCYGDSNSSEFVIKFCGDEYILDTENTSSVMVLLHELEHVRQFSEKTCYSPKIMELRACKAETMARG